MGLRLKFNLVLLAAFVLALAATGYVTQRLLNANAMDEVVRSGDLLMENALAIRAYTVNQVKPLLEPMLDRRFLPQSVPAFAATETLYALRQRFPDFSYKEATLNPTNPRNRADSTEIEIIKRFVADPKLTEIRGERYTTSGPVLYVARPIQIKNGACLQCHSQATAAPVTQIALYGADNGFGWQLNDVVGAQIVTVPMSLPIRNAEAAFRTFMLSLAIVFAVIFVVLNVMLSVVIIKPITELSAAADQISVGKVNLPEFADSGSDEIAGLRRSFNRMRRSLGMAMKMLEK